MTTPTGADANKDTLCGFRDRPGARECGKPESDFDHRHGMFCGPNPRHTDHYGCHPFQPRSTEATFVDEYEFETWEEAWGVAPSADTLMENFRLGFLLGRATKDQVAQTPDNPAGPFDAH